MKFAFVTPYYKETREQLERCINSVRAQSVPADHILVADGHPQDWIATEPVRHIVLDRAHGNFGNTPRGIGALLAIGASYDGIGFLDADNWLENNHLESCLGVSVGAEPCDYVIARRNWCRNDRSIIAIRDEPIDAHVDTNCFFLLPGSFHVIPHFALIPRELSPICDRIFYAALKNARLRFVALKNRTVNYYCSWALMYRAVGEVPPADAKESVDLAPMIEWIKARTPQQLRIASSMCGFDLRQFEQLLIPPQRR